MPLQLSLITDQWEHPPQCQPHSANRLQLIQNQWLVMREEVGVVEDRDEQRRGMEVPAEISAISALEVQFGNNVQFLPESKIPLPAGFTIGDEKLAALCAKEALWVKERLI